MKQCWSMRFGERKVAEMSNKYTIIDDFQAGPTDIRVLVLDRDYEFTEPLTRSLAIIDGKEYKFHFNSIRCWATIKSHDSFTGKVVEFV